ncbi:alpha-tocopherol transfer protein-like [Nilaparvata lugens]|uniref:alpha-tocopherol transfer protein-like n=1 Tax=Nilaparvata lugens TaxID=108931 RepID=UPI000B985E3B|nr:alpha-tocopherol transfer protein-like [Nilaparvata lugens]
MAPSVNLDNKLQSEVDAIYNSKVLLEPATSEQWKKLYKDLEMNPGQLKEDIQTIRTWLAKQSHLPQTASDNLIASFIVGCKNSLERTKQKLDAFYTIRNQLPELFLNNDPTRQEAIDATRPVRIFLLPKLHPDGCRILVTSYRNNDTTFYDVKENLKRILGVMTIRMNSEPFYRGDYMICDATHFSLGHAVKLTPTLMRNFLHCIQDVLPLQIKGIVFYNAPPILEKTLNNVIKPFLKKKIADRIHLYSQDHTALLKHFPKEVLPKNLGGDEPVDDVIDALWDKKLESYRDWFMNEGNETTDESKRPSNASFHPSQFGLEGSFRKLTID